jgi:hypothetical protein
VCYGGVHEATGAKRSTIDARQRLEKLRGM